MTGQAAPDVIIGGGIRARGSPTMTDQTATDLSESFKSAFRCHPAGVAIISADPGDRPVAITVSSLISVSSAPPTIAFSLSASSSSTAPLLRAETMVIHLLRFGDLALAQLGATSGADRFGPGVAWERLSTGEPRYTTVSTWFRARRVGTLQLAGGTLIAAELLSGQAGGPPGTPEEESLIYLDRRWHSLREQIESKI